MFPLFRCSLFRSPLYQEKPNYLTAILKLTLASLILSLFSAFGINLPKQTLSSLGAARVPEGQGRHDLLLLHIGKQLLREPSRLNSLSRSNPTKFFRTGTGQAYLLFEFRAEPVDEGVLHENLREGGHWNVYVGEHCDTCETRALILIFYVVAWQSN